MSRDRPWLEARPRLKTKARAFNSFGRKLVIASKLTDGRRERLLTLRAELLSKGAPAGTLDLRLRTAAGVLLDLVEQGWEVSVAAGSLRTRTPDSTGATKERIRQAHLVERDAYLREAAVREFVSSMEQRRLTPRGWQSIYSLMRDGAELAAQLRIASATPDAAQREANLAHAISPYLQFVEPGAVDFYTGFSLGDIWRYFRLTWVNTPRSVPGRSLQILVRDAAAPNNPVIGIAALGSSVVQQEIRDRWIGWQGDDFVERLRSAPSARLGRWLTRSLNGLLDGIYVADLIEHGVIRRRDLTHPNDDVLRALQQEAGKARALHRLFPAAAEHKRRGSNWEEAARSQLFRSKRCDRLARLLAIRLAFEGAGFGRGTKTELTIALSDRGFRTAASRLVRLVKAQHVGIDMMDLTVCGAIAPYNRILGGKLVCSLLLSPEVVAYYNRRYARRASVIASSMKGGAVTRRPRLALLCTTSLYGVGSSQYNRIRIPADAVGGEPGQRLEYVELGLSKGYGSFHFSTATVATINTLLARRTEGRRVNSIFGEGVNPLMRKIREALDSLGLPSDAILKHGNPRVIYAIPLATNFREVLLGREAEPHYFLSIKAGPEATAALAAFWRRRWLARRILDASILADVARNTLTYPVKHGARVATGVGDEDDGRVDLFTDITGEAS